MQLFINPKQTKLIELFKSKFPNTLIKKPNELPNPVYPLRRKPYSVARTCHACNLNYPHHHTVLPIAQQAAH